MTLKSESFGGSAQVLGRLSPVCRPDEVHQAEDGEGTKTGPVTFPRRPPPQTGGQGSETLPRLAGLVFILILDRNFRRRKGRQTIRQTGLPEVQISSCCYTHRKGRKLDYHKLP
jgi:hypothetical protein